MHSLKQYRQRVAQILGPFFEGTVSSGTTATLTDTSWPVKSSLSQDDLYRDQFLLRPDAVLSADKTRIVSTYAATSGTLTPDQVWTNAPAANERYEIHGMIEPWTDLRACINESLKRILIPAEFTITPTDSEDRRHSLAAVAPWLTEPTWVRQVGYLATGEDREEVNPYRRVIRGRCARRGATLYIEHPSIGFNTTDTLYVLALKPAYYHCTPAGNVKWFIKTTDDGSTFTNYTDEVNDHSAITYADLSSLSTFANGDYFFIAGDRRFAGLRVGVHSANSNASTLSIEYWNGLDWDSLTIADGTASSGCTLLQDGDITWTMPTDWAMSTTGATTDYGLAYWIRCYVSAALDSTSRLHSVALLNEATKADGLHSDVSEAEPDIEWVAWGAAVEAWRRYGHILEASANRRLVSDRQEAAAVFAKLTRQHLTVPELTFRPLGHWGPL